MEYGNTGVSSESHLCQSLIAPGDCKKEKNVRIIGMDDSKTEHQCECSILSDNNDDSEINELKVYF